VGRSCRGSLRALLLAGVPNPFVYRRAKSYQASIPLRAGYTSEVAILWLRAVDGVRPTSTDVIGVLSAWLGRQSSYGGHKAPSDDLPRKRRRVQRVRRAESTPRRQSKAPSAGSRTGVRTREVVSPEHLSFPNERVQLRGSVQGSVLQEKL
jgi:hypothetical protein